MIKKIMTLLIALVLVFLTGCKDKPAVSDEVTDYGYFEGYYSQLAHDVTNENGIVTNQLYFLCTDPEFKDPVGKKDVYFDGETGEMTRYTVTIGVLKVELIVSYTKGENASYYSEMHFDDDENIEYGSWENNYINNDGQQVRAVGEQTYYPGGWAVKTFRQEEYRDGELYETVTREYDEDGNMTSENIE